MTNGVYIFFHFFPWLAIPATLGGVQLALHFKRQKKTFPLVIVSFVTLILFSVAASWFIFRGDLYARMWAKNTLEFFGIPAHYW